VTTGNRSAEIVRVDVGGGLAYWTVLDGPSWIWSPSSILGGCGALTCGDVAADAILRH
jgi:hypothetical protein